MSLKLKKLLGIGQKTKPVLMKDVDPAPQDPHHEQRVNDAVGKLVGSLVDLERRSFVLRRELSQMTLHIVANQSHPNPNRRKDT